MKIECHRCHAETVMPKSGICLTCGLKNPEATDMSGRAFIGERRRSLQADMAAVLESLRQIVRLKEPEKIKQELQRLIQSQSESRGIQTDQGDAVFKNPSAHQPVGGKTKRCS